MTQPWSGTVPWRPVDLDEALQQFPELRQSLLARYDDCPLSALFETRYSNGWSTHPQAAGTMFHRFAAKALKTMKEVGSRTIPQEEALQILYECVRQKDIPGRERVRVSLKDMRLLRTAVLKWSHDNEFSVDRIVDIERRLYGKIRYADPAGGFVERTLTGQIDVLLFDPPDGAIIIDWKLTWALPPEKRKEGPDYDPTIRLSAEGYFQQRFYGWLVLKNYPAVQKVTLREFYPLRTKVRQATLHRADMEHIEEELAILTEAWDDSVRAGAKAAGTAVEDDHWPASPGKHCGFCLAPGRCPIDPEARREGMIESEDDATRVAAEMIVAEKARDTRREAAKVWCANHGDVPVKASKGRYVMGFRPNKTGNGQEFGIFSVDASDRGPADPELAASMKASVEEARKLRDENKSKRGRTKAA